MGLFGCKAEKVTDIYVYKEYSIYYDVKEPCSVVYKNGKREYNDSALIKARGGSSARFKKKSYSLELDNAYKLGELPKDDDWILNANYIDKTFMRHKINFDLFNDMHKDNRAAKCAYFNFHLNDAYRGLYVLMEEINGGMLNVDKKDTMAMVFKDPPVFRTGKLSYVRDTSNYYQQKYPKIHERNHTTYIQEFRQFLFTSSDSSFAKEIAHWIDIDNVMDWHILLLFSNNGDGVLKNFYLYKINEATPFKIAIWDSDHSFGRDGDNEHNLMERKLDCNKAILLKRLSEIPETHYQKNMKKRWFELRKRNIISRSGFKKRMRVIDKTIATELDKNFEKWPVNSKNYFDADSYEQEVLLMQEFVDLRILQLDAYFEAL